MKTICGTIVKTRRTLMFDQPWLQTHHRQNSLPLLLER